MKEVIVKVVNFVIGVLYLIIGMLIVAVLFQGDIPFWQRAVTLIGGGCVLFLLWLVSGYVEKKLIGK